MTTQTVQATPITREIAQKVLNTIDEGLVVGSGIPVPGKMCVEAAVCYALGLPHSDNPSCVARSLRRLKIRLNDAEWSSTQSRARGLRRLGLAQLDSKDALDEPEFAKRVVHLAITKLVPAALRAAASTHKDSNDGAALNAAAERCERTADRAACVEARDTAKAIHSAGVDTDAMYSAARAARTALAATDAAASGFPTNDAANDASACANDAANAVCAAYGSGASDRLLSEFAEDVVQVLIAMKAPGCEWLDLTAAV